VDIQHLRHSLKVKWLLYYQQNRPWLVRLRIWGTFDGQRRPSSSFILAIMSNVEPQLTQLFPFIVALNNNPDGIVAALGLNFNPDEELKSLTPENAVSKTNGNGLPETSLIAETNGNGLSETSLILETNGNGLSETSLAETNGNGNGLPIHLPSVTDKATPLPFIKTSDLTSRLDESCHGSRPNAGLVLSLLAVIGSLAVVVIAFTG
jgi:hypothetical protein